MALTIAQLQTFSNTKPELRYITEQIIDYLEATLGIGFTTDGDIVITDFTKGYVLTSQTGRRARIILTEDVSNNLQTEIQEIV